jgi:hypothetical protein
MPGKLAKAQSHQNLIASFERAPSAADAHHGRG